MKQDNVSLEEDCVVQVLLKHYEIISKSISFQEKQINITSLWIITFIEPISESEVHSS